MNSYSEIKYTLQFEDGETEDITITPYQKNSAFLTNTKTRAMELNAEDSDVQLANFGMLCSKNGAEIRTGNNYPLYAPIKNAQVVSVEREDFNLN